jgi:MFS family permease
MGAFDFANVGGYALGAFLGSRLDITYSANLSTAFLLTGAIIAVSFVVAFLALAEPPHIARGKELSLNPLRSLDSRAKATLPIWLGVTVLLGMVFFLPRAFERAGVGGGTTGEVLVAGILVLGLGSIGFGALSDRLGRIRVMLIGVAGLLGLLITLTASFNQGIGGLYRNLPFIGVFALATSAIVPTILANVGDRAMVERRGSAMGLYSVMLSGGTAVGTLVAGVAHGFSGLLGVLESGTFIFLWACLLSAGLLLRTREAAENKPA